MVIWRRKLMYENSLQNYRIRNIFFASVVLSRRKIFEALEKI